MTKQLDIVFDDKLDEIKCIILNYLFDNNEKEINNWNNNKNIIINDNFKSLLQGDWNRKPLVDRLNLKVLLGKKITKDNIFKLFVNELKIKSSTHTYSQNFNPNWFFIFYKEFYENNIFDFDPYLNNNDEMKGILFNNNQKYRIETLKIIELHSRFLLNKNFYKLLGKNTFLKYFIENCYIQYKIVDNMFGNNYIDLCYIIEGDQNLLLEINEYHHNEIKDFTRSITVLLNSSSRLVNYNVNDYQFTNDIVYENLVKNLCKIMYNKNLQTNAIKLFLTEINNMELAMINVGVSLYKKDYNLKLGEILDLPFFDKSENKLTVEKIIKCVVRKGNIIPNKDFVEKYKKDITIENLIFDKDLIELTSFGIKNLLLSIDGKFWSRRSDYINFMDELENEYYKVIEEIIKDDNYEILQQECCTMKNIIGLLRYNQNEFFDNVRTIKELKNNIHKTVPFIIKTSDRSYVDYNLLSSILVKDIKDKININEFGNNQYITHYRLLYPSELERIYDNDGFI